MLSLRAAFFALRTVFLVARKVENALRTTPKRFFAVVLHRDGELSF